MATLSTISFSAMAGCKAPAPSWKGSKVSGRSLISMAITRRGLLSLRSSRLCVYAVTCISLPSMLHFDWQQQPEVVLLHCQPERAAHAGEGGDGEQGDGHCEAAAGAGRGRSADAGVQVHGVRRRLAGHGGDRDGAGGGVQDHRRGGQRPEHFHHPGRRRPHRKARRRQARGLIVSPAYCLLDGVDVLQAEKLFVFFNFFPA
uniref:Uncharacterized protein n=1 Tax=Arundo donax TaxID=35708 RepID=A0A0A8XQB6_ARUDO